MASGDLAGSDVDGLDTHFAGCVGRSGSRASAGEKVLRLADAVRGLFRSPDAAPDSLGHVSVGGRRDAVGSVGLRTICAALPLHAGRLLLRLLERLSLIHI